MQLVSLTPADLAPARALLARACRFDRAAEVAEEKLFGRGPSGVLPVALGAFDRAALVGVAAASPGFVRVLAVDPAHRGRGVGTALLDAIEARDHGDRLRVLAEPGNYLAPGVDERDDETLAWLLRRGYLRTGRSENLLIECDAPLTSVARAAELADRARAAGYRVARVTAAELDEVAAEVAAHFSATWAFELARAGTAGVHIARDRRGRFAAFAAHDGNNRGLGWFGPAGTLPDHRGHGLGAALLVACLVDVAAAGHAVCEVAWIGPRDFYQRVVGIAGSRHFAVLDKDLS